MIYLATTLIMFMPAAEIADPAAFISTLFNSIEDAQFEYEGTERVYYPSRNKWNIESKFSGSVLFRNDLSLKLEKISHIGGPDAASKTVVTMKSSALSGRAISYSEMGGKSVFSMETTESLINSTEFSISGLQLFLVPYLKYLSIDRSRKFLHVGQAEIDGVICEVISCGRSFIQNNEENADFHEERRFYLDMNRGGHPLKVEFLDSGEIYAKIFNVRLTDVATSDGKIIWMPIVAEHQFLTTKNNMETPGRSLKLGQPYRITNVTVLKGSFVMNQKPKDVDFILRDKHGNVITKKSVESKNAAVERNKKITKPMTTQEAQTLLEEALREGEAQRGQLKGQFEETSERGISTVWIPRLLGFIGLIGLATASYIKRYGN